MSGYYSANRYGSGIFWRRAAVLATLLAVGWPAPGRAVDNDADDQSVVASSLYHLAQEGKEQVGMASWYQAKPCRRKLADGEKPLDPTLVAAHRTLPLGARVRVTNLRNGRSTEVRINDRGPFIRGRIIDVSHHAARELGMIDSGTAQVRVEVVQSSDV